MGKASLIAIFSFDRRSRIKTPQERQIFSSVITKQFQIPYIVVQNNGVGINIRFNNALQWFKTTEIHNCRHLSHAKGLKITLRGFNESLWLMHLCTTNYLLVLIADLFWWCFILGRCSFMSATKSVLICGPRLLALLHSTASLEMKNVTALNLSNYTAGIKS